VFGGTVNLDHYLKDETGGRRFWPVQCGAEIRLVKLNFDRDQIWAEAVVRYRKKEPWWLDAPELIQEAAEQQEERYQSAPGGGPTRGGLPGRTRASVPEILAEATQKEVGQWARADEVRVGVILRRLDWIIIERPRDGATRRRVYGPRGG